MIKVIHEFKEISVSGFSEDGFPLIGNSIGDYASFPTAEASRYHGWVVFEGGAMIKILDELLPPGLQPVRIVRTLSGGAASRTVGSRSEKFSLGQNHILLAEYSRAAVIEPLLDLRPLLEVPEESGRYAVKVFKDHALIDASAGNRRFFIACLGDRGRFRVRDAWRFKTYPFDRRRHSPPFHRRLFHPFTAEGNRFVFAVSPDPRRAIELARGAIRRFPLAEREELRRSFPFALGTPRELPKEIAAASALAFRSLKTMYLPAVSPHYLRAGLPWFPGVWSRDALIALSPFPREARLSILRVFFGELEKRRVLPQTLGGGGISADAPGWLGVRLAGVLPLLKPAKRDLVERLEEAIRELKDRNSRGGLIVNGEQETWMDSVSRGGARIEIQALYLALFHLLHELTYRDEYQKRERELAAAVRENFWTGEILKDGVHDPTVRPNLFLAAYLYPRLLSATDWRVCFRNALRALYLPWGGLSSIDQRDQRFHAESTGEDPQSYHNGDSWFYLNNLAAIVLHRLAPGVFKAEIQKILKASTEEILWRGALGHHGELSSANKLESSGAWAQAWSNAMYLELVSALYCHS